MITDKYAQIKSPREGKRGPYIAKRPARFVYRYNGQGDKRHVKTVRGIFNVIARDCYKYIVVWVPNEDASMIRLHYKLLGNLYASNDGVSKEYRDTIFFKLERKNVRR